MSLSRRPTLTHPQARHVHTTYDSYGAAVADYTWFPGPQVLYVRWHGHVTGDELVRAAHTGLRLNQHWQPRVLFHDLRGSTGEWGEDSARPWLEYEWVPGIQSQCPNLRGIVTLFDARMTMPYANTLIISLLDQQFEFRVFYSLLSAWRWVDQRTRPHAEPGAWFPALPA
ncbi:hypothetical protein [Hymenobacter sp. BRD67]|uniref:hypothetical protein n=1 Tax=Hymenobacter sp. BRD67 TaxID=2675877 RepID=UPI001564CA5B|nr:hypothetical protein [Hymenobacter sp. BRD67]QKG52381.1 hypothetical protein GKZ67_06855 [Hymenobacter sp. BRD67]